MPIALIPKQAWNYILEREQKLPKDQQTIFKVRALTGAERVIYKDQAINTGLYSGMASTLIFGLLGWENFKDKDGKVPEFKKSEDGNCDLSNLDYLDDDAYEIARAIIQRSQLSETDRKN